MSTHKQEVNLPLEVAEDAVREYLASKMFLPAYLETQKMDITLVPAKGPRPASINVTLEPLPAEVPEKPVKRTRTKAAPKVAEEGLEQTDALKGAIDKEGAEGAKKAIDTAARAEELKKVNSPDISEEPPEENAGTEPVFGSKTEGPEVSHEGDKPKKIPNFAI